MSVKLSNEGSLWIFRRVFYEPLTESPNQDLIKHISFLPLLQCPLAILLLVTSTSTSNVNTDQFENQFSTNSTSLFSGNTSHPTFHATSTGPNYALPPASGDKSSVQTANQRNASDVNSVHKTGEKSASIKLQTKQASEHPQHPQHPQLSSNTTADKSERWSDWSDCSAACGLGVQTQRLESSSEFSSIKYRVCKKQVSTFCSILFSTRQVITSGWLSDWRLPGEIARISFRQVLDKIMFIKYVGRNLLELIEDTLIVAVEMKHCLIM